MSHGHERTEKICLNCGATLYGRYCHVCGQENVQPRESFGQLLKHFFEDLTHFDGKFFSTIKYLITKPGFLPKEYLAGRRARYLHPIRMYLFISFIFFLVFATFFVSGLGGQPDRSINSKGDTTINLLGKPEQNNRISYKIPTKIQTLEEYDSTQKALPVNERDGAFKQYWTRRTFAAGKELEHDPNEFMHRFIEKFFHSLPQMFFIILPLFALVLYLLYIRRRNEYNYVAHAIFAVHYYCFVFIGWFFILLGTLNANVNSIAQPVLFITILAYLYIAMLKFYKQGWLKTLFKYFILNILVFCLIIIVAIVYGLNAFLSAGA